MTDPTHPGGSTDPVEPAGSGSPDADAASRRRRVQYAVIAAVAAVLVIVAIIVATSGKDDDDVDTVGQVTTTVATTTSDGAATTSSATTAATTTTAAASTTVAPTTTTTATTTTAGPSLPGATTDPKTGAASGTSPALLSKLRVSCNAGSDRIVFEFLDGAMPAWQVRYVDGPITTDGSGETVSVKGGAYLSVHLEGAAGHDLSQPSVPATYTGPNRVAANCPAATEVVQTGEFEAVYNWVIGVDAKQPFTVTTLSGPSRLVVDVAHG